MPSGLQQGVETKRQGIMHPTVTACMRLAGDSSFGDEGVSALSSGLIGSRYLQALDLENKVDVWGLQPCRSPEGDRIHDQGCMCVPAVQPMGKMPSVAADRAGSPTDTMTLSHYSNQNTGGRWGLGLLVSPFLTGHRGARCADALHCAGAEPRTEEAESIQEPVG